MEVIRMVKLHIPIEENGEKDVVERFREISTRYGRKVDYEEISRILEKRFGEVD